MVLNNTTPMRIFRRVHIFRPAGCTFPHRAYSGGRSGTTDSNEDSSTVESATESGIRSGPGTESVAGSYDGWRSSTDSYARDSSTDSYVRDSSTDSCTGS